MEFIDLASQLRSMRTAIDKRIADVLEHGQFIMGPEVSELELRLAEYVGVKHCVTCANGTDALQIALMSYDIGPGDIVITTPFTFFSTAEVIALVGATPYFVDIESETFNISPDAVESAIVDIHQRNLGPIRAIIAVDLFGLPANYPRLEVLCQEHNIVLIEDAAQGFGGKIKERRAGSFGDIATTSFFPAKPLGCFGDGGALFTNDDNIAELAKSIRVHGKGTHKYENVRVGLNSRLDTIQAAILLEKLQHFSSELEHRQQVSRCYQSITDHYLKPQLPSGFVSSWAQYTLVVEPQQRETMQLLLQEKGIPTAIYYPTPLNLQPVFLESISPPTPVSEKLAQQVISLPMSGYLELSDAQRVVEVINGLQPSSGS